jgi:SWIM zinc finger
MASAVRQHPEARTKECPSLIEKSLALTAQESTTRTERGRQLYAERAEEIRFKGGVWLVPSCSHLPSVYEVTLGLRPSCECKDFDYNGHQEPCKHILACRLAEADRTHADLRIDFPIEEELLAACEYTLNWFKKWEEHANHGNDFGGEYAVMKRLRRSIRIAREEA